MARALAASGRGANHRAWTAVRRSLLDLMTMRLDLTAGISGPLAVYCRGAATPTITYTRGSVGTRFDSSGTLQEEAIDAPRIDHYPDSGASRGLLVEESRINSIRNNTMQGAVAGTPGTNPTFWNVGATPGGLTRDIVAIGSERGISYIDYRYYGNLAGATIVDIAYEVAGSLAAAVGETWTNSVFLKLSGGTLTNITSINLQIFEFDAGLGFLTGQNTAKTVTSTFLERHEDTRTLTDAATASVRPGIRISFAAGDIDITLRIGLPQLELGSGATSVIKTSSAAVTRAIDVAAMTGTNFSSWYNQTEGTFVVKASSSVNPIAATYPRAIAVTNGGTSELISQYAITGVQPRYVITDGGVSQMDINVGSPVSINTFYKMASSYKLNNCAASVDGGTVVTDTVATIPTPTRFDIGSLSSGGQHWNGHIASIDYCPARLSNEQLQALSL